MKWYQQRKFDDQPAGLEANVNMEAPFGGRAGGKPALSEGEIADIVAFLKTLTDGYQVNK
jgi:cytochrome c peroxidase